MDTYETSIYTAVVITALVLGCTIVYFAFSVYRQQRQYLRMQRIYFSEEINVLENERKRVSRDLHDELGPLVSLSKTHIGFVRPTDEEECRHLQKANGHLEELMKRMRQIAINLSPSALERKGLEFAIKEFLEELEAVCAIRLRFVFDVQHTIEAEKGLHLYRMIQEIAHNSIKHSGCNEFYIHIKERKKRLYLFCRDNGEGFATDKQDPQNRGLGLKSIQSRTEMLEGKMKLSSAPGKGTDYFFEFPFNYSR